MPCVYILNFVLRVTVVKKLNSDGIFATKSFIVSPEKAIIAIAKITALNILTTFSITAIFSHVLQ